MKARIKQKTSNGFETLHIETSVDLVKTLPKTKQIVADIAEQQDVSIVIHDPGTICRNPLEVLKLVSGGVSQTKTIAENVSASTEFTYPLSDPIVIDGGEIYETDIIDFSTYKKVERIEVV